MSALITQADLELQFGPERVAQVFSLTGPDGSTGSVDSATLVLAISLASAEAERVIWGAYPATLSPVPDALKQLVGILVMRNGMMRRPEHCRLRPEEVPYFNEWKQARADLKELREGFQRLPAPAPAPKNVGAQVQGPAFVFTPDASTGTGGFAGGGY